LILWAVASIFFPGVAVARVQALLEQRQTRRRYLFYQRLNIFFLGVILVVSGLLAPDLKKPVSFPIMGLIFVSVLTCNKLNLGRWAAYHRKSKK